MSPLAAIAVQSLTFMTREISLNRAVAPYDPKVSAAITTPQCSRYPLATSPMAIIWPIGRLKLVSGEIFDYKLQPKINMTDALFPRFNW